MSMLKKERSISDKNSEIFFVEWNNSSTVATNFSTLKSLVDVKRRVKGHKGKINVKMPYRINSYSSHMRGIDYHD